MYARKWDITITCNKILTVFYKRKTVKTIFDFRSLFVQMITAFIAIVILASITVGIPAICLLQNQLDRQAWAQIEQGQRVTIALHNSHYNEILNLAILTAQRPTLQEMLAQHDLSALTGYLITLQSGADLDGIMICDPEDQLVATTTDKNNPATICKTWKSGNYQLNRDNHQVCLTAHQAIMNESEYLGEVFVCNSIDDDFERQLREQTGLDHIIWIEGTSISTSFPGGASTLGSITPDEVFLSEPPSRRFFELGNVPYYAALIPLDDVGLIAEVALDVNEIFATRTRLAAILITSVLGISLLGSILGVVLARQISRPLVQLSKSATSFSQGELESPVKTETHVREITQVARTLESARVDLLAMVTSLQSERDWSEHLLTSIVEGIIILDHNNRITFFSHGAERITGWRSSEVMGKNCNQIFQLAQSSQLFSEVLPEPGGRGKVDVLLGVEREASLAVTRAKLAPSGVTDAEIALVFRDISEEEAIHRLLGNFLANVAHEFRTPLSALAASIELLLDQAPDLSQSELVELHTSLHLGILGLHTLVDNLLESANIEARRFTVSPREIDLGNIIADASQTMQPLLKKYGQHLTIELPIIIPIVKTDPRRTVQVLINLISNASKYGPPDEEIILRVTTNPKWACVSVIDRGPGIAPIHRENLFRRFVFPDADDAVSQAGAGLGLSVVKAIVEAQGGQVGVGDNEGDGSIFWFTLPVVRA
jgi:two-component system phosphate regulon sensor histidine kinase PhoR